MKKVISYLVNKLFLSAFLICLITGAEGIAIQYKIHPLIGAILTVLLGSIFIDYIRMEDKK